MLPQLIDIHAHIQFNAFRDDADEVIRRAINAGVLMIAPSSQMSTSLRAIEYAKKYPGKIWAGVGLHPIHLKPAYFDPSEEGAPAFHTRVEDFDAAAYRELAARPEVVAIGETGLDYAEKLQVSEKDRGEQERIFREQIEIALAVGKPIIQHCRSGLVEGKPRDAHDDALRIITEYVPRGLRGTAHCYSGNLEQAKKYLDLGFYLSFTGLITFNHSWDEVIRFAPLDRLMVETDAPYMTPVPVRRPVRRSLDEGGSLGEGGPHRGKRNEPAYVRYVAEKIADLKDIPFEKVAEQTTENAQQLFPLQLPKM